VADGQWSVANAKARFSELIERARSEGPQRVSRHGKAAVVVVSAAEWDRSKQPARSVVDVLLDPAVRGILSPDEARLFERDLADSRETPGF
jgi:prevent-host-death family protein